MPKALASIALTFSMLITNHSMSSSAPTTTTTLVPASKMVEWGKVAHCETGGNWKHQGAMYEGGLGILAWNWKYFGGLAYAPHAYLATPQQQVAIAIKIQHGLPTPDQNGWCAAW